MGRVNSDLERQLREKIGMMVDLLVEEILAGMRAVSVPPTPALRDSRTQLVRVRELLESHEWMTAPEIADATGMDDSAVRVVLYSHQGKLFEKRTDSPRRVYWRLVNATTPIDGADPSVVSGPSSVEGGVLAGA